MIFILRKRHQITVLNKTKKISSRSRRRGTKTRKIRRCALLISGAAFFILLGCGIFSFFEKGRTDETMSRQKVLPKITIDTKLLKKNKYSRPGIALKGVKSVVVHYTANPGTDALDNRNYFNNLPKLNENKKSPTFASSHFVVGLKGQIIQCIPLNEIAYASNDRNTDSIAIECCHPDKTGKFNALTYKALVELVSYLCIRYDLSEQDVIRHYDVTGKKCPLYFVQHEDEWETFKKDVGKCLPLTV